MPLSDTRAALIAASKEQRQGEMSHETSQRHKDNVLQTITKNFQRLYKEPYEALKDTLQTFTQEYAVGALTEEEQAQLRLWRQGSVMGSREPLDKRLNTAMKLFGPGATVINGKPVKAEQIRKLYDTVPRADPDLTDIPGETGIVGRQDPELTTIPVESGKPDPELGDLSNLKVEQIFREYGKKALPDDLFKANRENTAVLKAAGKELNIYKRGKVSDKDAEINALKDAFEQRFGLDERGVPNAYVFQHVGKSGDALIFSSRYPANDPRTAEALMKTKELAERLNMPIGIPRFGMALGKGDTPITDMGLSYKAEHDFVGYLGHEDDLWKAVNQGFDSPMRPPNPIELYWKPKSFKGEPHF